jgi:hypothetical protein
LRLCNRNTAVSATDRDIPLAADDWNLIGYSADEPFYLEDATFTDSSDGTTYTLADAITNDKVYGYLAYYDSTPSLAKDRKYKYASISSLGVDDSNLQPKTGYWVYAKEAGTLNLPGAGGTLSGETYDWSKLRFSNGTDELNITDAGPSGAGWIESTLQTWNQSGYILDNPLLGPVYKFIEISNTDTAATDKLESQKGYFVLSRKDNITLIRQN